MKRRIKVIKNDEEYEKTIKKNRIYDPIVMTDEDCEREYQIIKDNIYIIENLQTDPSLKSMNLHDFVSFNYAKTLQYKKKICLDPNNVIYSEFNKKQKNMLNNISQKIDKNINTLNDSKISMLKKIHNIYKLCLAMICLINTSDDMKKVTIKVKKLSLNN